MSGTQAQSVVESGDTVEVMMRLALGMTGGLPASDA